MSESLVFDDCPEEGVGTEARVGIRLLRTKKLYAEINKLLLEVDALNSVVRHQAQQQPSQGGVGLKKLTSSRMVDLTRKDEDEDSLREELHKARADRLRALAENAILDRSLIDANLRADSARYLMEKAVNDAAAAKQTIGELHAELRRWQGAKETRRYETDTQPGHRTESI